MLGYMALVVKMDRQHSIDEIHEITYSSARQNIPEDAYQKLTDTISYRKKFATQPAEFSKIFPNYIIKPLYTWLCRIFYTNGISLPLATVLPSVISYLFLGLFLFHWLSKYIQTGIAFLGGLLLMSSTFITSIARLSTPD
ncbi:MAG TPA: hypothetical protein VFH08_13975, partial [Chitinophagaceae bacterium]|nr:hypothetical protein [Chitinophagaceae bacterium]